MTISTLLFKSNRTLFTTQAECDAEFQGLSFNLRYHIDEANAPEQVACPVPRSFLRHEDQTCVIFIWNFTDECNSTQFGHYFDSIIAPNSSSLESRLDYLVTGLKQG